MLRTFSTSNHNEILKITRALSLSDQYWLKSKNESIQYEDVSPYLHESWAEGEYFSRCSIATLFTNGAATKQRDNRYWLRKFNSSKEYQVYQLINEIYSECILIPETKLNNTDLLIKNFTSLNPPIFLEDLNQSSLLNYEENHFNILERVL